MEFEKLLELLENQRIEITSLTTITSVQRGKVRRKRIKSTDENRYAKIEYIRKHDSIRITAMFKRHPVCILITNFSKYNGIAKALQYIVETEQVWGHAKQLIINHLIPNSNKIQQQLEYSNVAYIRIR